jgi:hypothetical protein
MCAYDEEDDMCDVCQELKAKAKKEEQEEVAAVEEEEEKN